MWDCVRRANGIMVLRDLLFTKTPLSDADALRSLACQAMDGLARSATVRQIVSKMPLIANNELHCTCSYI
jgi:HIV-1 Vpr-binding protein